MKRFFSPIVPLVLVAFLAVASCTQDNRAEIDGIKNELAALKEKVASGEVDVKAQIATLQNLLTSYKQEVDPKLKDLQIQLNSQYAELSAADARIRNSLDEAQATLTAKINKNSSDIAATNKELQAAVAEYKKLVAAAVKVFESAMENMKKEQAEVDGEQDAAIVAMLAQFEIYKGAIDKSIEELQASVVALGVSLGVVAGDVEEIEDTVEELEAKVDANYAAALAYTDALKASVKATTDALAARIAANEEAIKKLNEETIPEIEEAILALQTAIEGIEEDVTALEEKKLDKETFAGFISEYLVWAASVETRVTTLEGKITTINGSILSINETISLLQTADNAIRNQIQEISSIIAKLDGNADVPGSVKNQIKALHEDIMGHLSDLQEEIEGEIETLQGDVEELQDAVEEINADIITIYGMIDAAEADIETINGKITSINSKIAALEGKVGTAETDIAQLKQDKAALESKLTTLENTVAALKTTLESRIDALEKLTTSLKTDIDKANAAIAIINGEADTEGSIKYAVAQLGAAVDERLEELRGKIQGNAEEIGKLKEEIGKLQQSIQSLVFVPQYQDLKFGIPFVKIDGVYKPYDVGPGFTVVYKVAPANLAKDLARAVNDALAKGIDPPFAFDIDSDLQTRAADTDPKLIIKDAMGDEGTGKITFFLSHRNFEPEGGNLDKYTVSLRADNEDYNVHVASHYVQATLQTIIELTILTDYVYKPDPATGMVEEDSKIATTGEHNYDIPYTDRKVHAFLQGYEMAAQDEKGIIRTFSQWKALNYDMPEVTEKAERFYGDAKEYINDSFKGSSSTFAMKNLNMIDVKKKVGLFNKYNITFTCGSHVANVRMRVTIGKYIGAFHLKLRYKMAWDYDQDAEVDHYNMDKTPDKWKSYTRKGDVYAPYSHFVVKAYLVVDGEERELSGANRVYGLSSLDFQYGRFTPKPAGVDFDVLGAYFDSRMLSLTEFTTTPGERLGEEYVYTGSYNCFDKYSTEPDVTTIVITTVDRKTEDILLPAPEKEVKLLNTVEYKSGDYYSITSDNFADRLMQAYVDQGIFGEGFDREKAFTGEFASMKEIEHAGLSANFEMVKSAGGGESGDENLQIRSMGEKLKSAVLHKVATGSDCQGQENPWDMTYETYVGQRVKFTWPLSVAPLHDYRFVTSGQDTFQVPIGWVGGPDAITKAQTELDLLNFSNYIQVKYEEEGSEHTVTTAHYKDSQIRLVPKLSLVNATEGVAIANSGTDALPCISNVTYYSQAPSVEVKSALYVKSGDTEFYVPGSDKMYVGETPVTSVSVMQSNPIAATQANPVNPTGMVSGVGLVELTMKDVLGHSIYLNGKAQDSQYPFAASIANIFRYVRFSVYSVNGNTSIRGWSMEGGDAFGISDTPDYVRLITSGVSAGTYTVVIKARTAWKDYYYTVKVNVN